MATVQKRDAQIQRQLRKVVRKILATVRHVATLGEEARKAHEEFERLTQGKGGNDAK